MSHLSCGSFPPEGGDGLGLWSVLVVQSACDIQINGRWEEGGWEAQTNMEETDGERLP